MAVGLLSVLVLNTVHIAEMARRRRPLAAGWFSKIDLVVRFIGSHTATVQVEREEVVDHGRPAETVVRGRPDLGMFLRPLHHLRDHARGVILLAPPADRRFPQLPHRAGPRLGMTGLHNLLRQSFHLNFGEVSLAWRKHGIGQLHDFVQVEVVKHPVTAHDDNVTLIGRDAVDGTAPLYHLDCERLVKVWINPGIHPSKLQRGLGMAIDSLHLGVAHNLKRLPGSLHPAQHDELAVSYGDDCDHGVQLAMNTC